LAGEAIEGLDVATDVGVQVLREVVVGNQQLDDHEHLQAHVRYEEVYDKSQADVSHYAHELVVVVSLAVILAQYAVLDGEGEDLVGLVSLAISHQSIEIAKRHHEKVPDQDGEDHDK
jgi:hypothetical protein